MLTLTFEFIVKALALLVIFMVVANAVKAQTAAGDVFTTVTYLPTTFGWVAPYWAKVSDTANMLAGYMRVQRAQDSIASLKTSMATKMDASAFTKTAMVALGMMAYTDSAAMLSPYQTAINSKVGKSSFSATNGITYNSTTGVFTLTKRQETYTGTTNGSGNYTVTYGTAYSVAPNVQFQINGGLVTQNALLTSSTTTGFTVNVKNRTDVVGLLPSYANVSGATVDVLVTEK